MVAKNNKHLIFLSHFSYLKLNVAKNDGAFSVKV